MGRTVIVEPVTRYLTMSVGGEETTTDRVFTSIVEARSDGLSASCLRGAVTVTIVGDNGALLCSYQRADNVWRDLCRGKAVVTADMQICSCGGTPTVATGKPYQHEQALGWFWSCRRCGAFTWSHVDPPRRDGLAESMRVPGRTQTEGARPAGD